ncbi:MAG TPA: sodium ion-translocating decarboxylase subunit beta, partial [bacterium]|nr:sodium ion-translocating decarboxylase subunit beta [bacterium]
MTISLFLSKLFAGVGTLIDGDWRISAGRIFLMLLGMLLVYLGRKGTLEPLIMIPMELGMAAVNAGVLVLDPSADFFRYFKSSG